MRSARFYLSALICWTSVCANSQREIKVLTSNQTPGSKPPAPYLWEVLEPHDPVLKMARKQRAVSRSASALYKAHRLSNRCDFPLDVIILQDATASFSDNIDAMRDVQVGLIHEGITRGHPNSRFSVVSFKDKPLWPLGDRRNDHCSQFDTTLQEGLEPMVSAYQSLTAAGGADAPENQFGALYNVLSSTQVGWQEDEGVTTKLVIVSTDAGPHFGGDSTSDLLPEFTPDYTDDQDSEVCLLHHYPTSAEMKARILSSNAYVAFLIYDGDWANGWAAKSWEAFNEYIGQSSEFIAAQAPDSSDFWERLAEIIHALERIECEIEETTSTTTDSATTTKVDNTVAEADSTLTDATTESESTTDATSESLTDATEERSTEESTSSTDELTTRKHPKTTTSKSTSEKSADDKTSTCDSSGDSQNSADCPPSPCVCPCEHCTCCPEMVIQFRRKPKQMHLAVVN